jgi:spermidine synthase
MTGLHGGDRALLRITLLSALALFLEMLLVRWLGTEVRIFAYLQNAVLVTAFLGLGLGARNAREPVRFLTGAVALAAIAFAIRDPFRWGIAEAMTQGLVASEDSVVWNRTLRGQGVLDRPSLRLAVVSFALTATLALLYGVAMAFRPLGQWLGRWMDAHPRPIAAYTANIVGSVAGIAVFDAVTLARTPPWIWLAVAGGGLAALAPRADESGSRRVAAALLVLALPLAGLPLGPGQATWSPYQKLSLTPLRGKDAASGQLETCGEMIEVNNTGYQVMLDLDPARMAARPGLYPANEIRASHYVIPYELVGRRERVLIVGAGSGNDAAAALRAGARAVHAVEIDPVIVEWGRERHPNRPHGSERVSITVDDARAFFRRHRETYDLVWFGLLDAHTTPSAYTNVRLDHFVYTRESFADMKRLLAPGGVVVLLFDPETWWIADRLVALLTETFGHRPLATPVHSSTMCLGPGGLLLIAGTQDAIEPVRTRATGDARLAATLSGADAFPLTTDVTTDDWPYLYLQARSLPKYHLLVGAACLAIGISLRRRLFRSGEDVHLPMLLLGAGFMLVEVAGVSRAALLFGTTWTVNAYVVGAILGMVLLANAIASHTRVDPAGWPFLALIGSVAALGVVPTAWLAGLPAAVRIVVGGGFLALPVLFSGLIFVSLWARSERKDLAFGSNLLGSLVGGVASMSTMLIGFRALTFLTVAVYLAALLLIRRGAARAAG